MATYEEVLHQALSLTPEEQLRLIETVVSIVRHRVIARPLRSVMEFKGIGKETWEGVDVEKYIEEERNSWDR